MKESIYSGKTLKRWFTKQSEILRLVTKDISGNYHIINLDKIDENQCYRLSYVDYRTSEIITVTVVQ